MISEETVKMMREILGDFTKKRHISMGEAALMLGYSPKNLRRHLDMFPNVWRLGSGDIRIPVKDIEAAIEAGKLHRPKKVKSEAVTA